ncbi:MAG TPA: NfeD family protein, partial [Gaiellales bacterium]|nr:NfeD family protein [Gaiellales bacterium]
HRQPLWSEANMLLLLAFVLLLFLPGPWNVIGFVVALALFIGEIAYWNSTVKGRRARVGAETLIGKTGTVISECRPDGQIKLLGTIWAAHCVAGAALGQTVRVIARSDLVLDVEPEREP